MPREINLKARTQWNIKMTYICHRSPYTLDLNIQIFMKQMDPKTFNSTLWDFAANTFCLQTMLMTTVENWKECNRNFNNPSGQFLNNCCACPNKDVHIYKKKHYVTRFPRVVFWHSETEIWILKLYTKYLYINKNIACADNLTFVTQKLPLLAIS